MNEPKDPRPLDPPWSFEYEDDGPTCRLCGICLTTPAEERRGVCDACFEAEQEEDVDEEE